MSDEERATLWPDEPWCLDCDNKGVVVVGEYTKRPRIVVCGCVLNRIDALRAELSALRAIVERSPE